MDPMQPTQPEQPSVPQVAMPTNANNSGLSKRTLMIIIGSIAAGLLVLCCACGGIAALANSQGNSSTSTSQGSHHNSAAATHTPAAKPTATATTTPPVPTATPKPLTRKQRAQPLVQNGISDSGMQSDVNSWTLDSDDSTKTFTITVVLNEPFDASSAKTSMQYLAFYIFRDMYTSAKVSINEVDIAFNGPLVDKYGKTSTGYYGIANLTFPTAQMFVWDNLTPDQAWGDYDQANSRQN